MAIDESKSKRATKPARGSTKSSLKSRAIQAAAMRKRRETLSSPLMQKLGKVICEMRERADLTQIGLADAADIDRVFLAYVEKGLQNMSIHALEKIAEAFGIRPSRLLMKAEKAMNVDHATAIESRRASKAKRDAARIAARKTRLSAATRASRR